MLPDLFCVGPFCLRTINVVLVLGLLLSSFVYYRKVREEHFSEYDAFDGFLLSLIMGLAAGRLAFVVTHFSDFGWQFWSWADIMSKPGFVGSVGLVVAGLYLFKVAKSFTPDAFQLLDIWSIAVTGGIGVVWLGLFLDGSAYGIATTTPLGMMFPGLIEPHLPIQLFSAAYFLGLAFYLNWIEYRYRTFSWYRSGKTSAQSGFLIAMTITLSSLWLLVVSWFRPPQLLVMGVTLDQVLGAVGMIWGIGMVYVRSGRRIRVPGRA